MTHVEGAGGPDRWARLFGLATLLGLACGVAGPFGSYPANMFNRLAFWVLLFWSGTMLLWPAVTLAIAYGSRRGFPALFAGAAGGLLASIPLAAIAAIAGHLMWPVHASAMPALEWYGCTLFVALPAIAGIYWLEIGRPDRLGAPAGGMVPPASGATASSAAGDAGIPDHLLETALCLQMEDHHVRVHSHARSSLYFAAMKPVIDQLGEQRGLQAHRSWWVARSAVLGVEEEGRSVTLMLVNGLRVPVARSRIALLRQQGWLDRPARTNPAVT